MSKTLWETTETSTFFLCKNSYNRLCLSTKSFRSERGSRWSVYYELYIDVLFLVNFMMDYILLLIVKRILKCSATHGSIFIGAIVGSLLTCLVVILPIPYAFVKFVLFHIFVNTCMIRVGLKIKTIPAFLKAIILLYAGGFLLGGVMEHFRQYVREGSLFFLLAFVSYYIVLGIFKFISYIQRWNQTHYKVDLYLDNEVYQVEGLIDTGNGLRDPISGQPISVLERGKAKELLEKSKGKNFRYVPYSTIGKAEGVLPVFRVDRMCIHRDVDCWVDKPLIGISEEKISTEREYDMILNPNLF